RGINVGGHNKIAMADLRELLTDLGYQNVQTHLQSGNAVFTSPVAEPGPHIEAAIAQKLGLRIDVMTRSRDELAEVVARNPLARIATNPAYYLVVFLSEAPESALDLPVTSEVFQLDGQQIYAWYPAGMGKAVVSTAQLEKRLGVRGTARNWNTVTTLLRLAN